MKTTSCWGNPPQRIYSFMKKLSPEASVCIVGCSDGKFVLPFLRKGFRVTGIDFDKIAIHGGEKIKPIDRQIISEKQYVPCKVKPQYDSLPTETIQIKGLLKRIEEEKLGKNFHLIQTDYYRNPLLEEFDVVFTSCSLQYKANRDLSLVKMIDTLKNSVKPNGYLYMDYMMALEDSHQWKAEQFLRTGQLKGFFLDGWEICYIREKKQPVFEAAHIDRPEDHFHRFGYVLARKMKK